SSLISAAVTIVQQVGCEIHVRTLLVSPEYGRKLDRIRPHHGELNGVLYELTEDNLQVGDGSQGPEVQLLSGGNVGIIGPGTHMGREVLDLQNPVLTQEEPAERREVQPLVFRALDNSVVEIEPVDVHIG